MALPGVTIAIKDGALGRLATGSTSDFGLIGITDQANKQNVITTVSDSSQIADFGTGDLADALNRAFQLGATKVYAVGVAANPDNAALLKAVDILLADSNLKEFIAIATITEKTFWASFATKLDNAATSHNYTFGIVQARAQKQNEDAATYVTALSNTATERGNVQNKRLQICAGQLTYSDSTGTNQTHPLLYTYIGWIQAKQPHHAVDAYQDGSLPTVQTTVPKFTDPQIETLADSGYVTTRQYYGKAGYYITLARLSTNKTSDFTTVETIRVINKAARQVRSQQLNYVNRNIALDGSPEGILQFKQQTELPLQAMKTANEITDYEVIIPEGQDIIGTQTIKTQVKIKPLGKLSYINTEISYTKNTGGN